MRWVSDAVKRGEGSSINKEAATRRLDSAYKRDQTKGCRNFQTQGEVLRSVERHNGSVQTAQQLYHNTSRPWMSEVVTKVVHVDLIDNLNPTEYLTKLVFLRVRF